MNMWNVESIGIVCMWEQYLNMHWNASKKNFLKALRFNLINMCFPLEANNLISARIQALLA